MTAKRKKTITERFTWQISFALVGSLIMILTFIKPLVFPAEKLTKKESVLEKIENLNKKVSNLEKIHKKDFNLTKKAIEKLERRQQHHFITIDERLNQVISILIGIKPYYKLRKGRRKR
jgi:hypothetical protein